MTRVKICGLRDPDSAIVAARAGADYIGFNFVEGVRRQLKPSQAKSVISEYHSRARSEGPRIVGLFANQSVEFVKQTALECGLDLVQLCGDEDDDYMKLLDVPIIRHVRVREGENVDQVVAEVAKQVGPVVDAGHLALLDKHQDGALGGTGVAFDWSIAANIATDYEFLLAGGLTPDNVAEAITTVKPWGVDVSSGVETRGVKDAKKVRDFVRIAKSVI